MYPRLKIISYDDKVITLEGPCFVTGKPHRVTIPLAGFERWQDGDFIQDVLPTVSPADREFLISGTSPEGWAQIFPSHSEEEGSDHD